MNVPTEPKHARSQKRCPSPPISVLVFRAPFVSVALACIFPGAARSEDQWLRLAVLTVAVLVLTKSIDLLLDRRKGLAFVVGVIAGINLILPSLLEPLTKQLAAKACIVTGTGAWGAASALVDRGAELVCGYGAIVPLALGVILAAVTLLMLQDEVRRGMRDVGFVAEGFRAERRRRRSV